MIKRLLVLCSLAFALHGQTDLLTSQTGAPCSYSYKNVYSPQIGCWALGGCYNGRNLDVSFYQQWACYYSVVWGEGESAIVDTSVGYKGPWPGVYYSYYYPSGLQAVAAATIYDVFDGAEAASYSGIDEQNCNPDFQDYFSGPYSYEC